MFVFDKGIALMRQDVDIFHLSPESEVTQQNLVKLCHSIVVVGEFVIADIDSPGLLCKGADSLHVLTEGAEACPSKDVFVLVNCLAFRQGGNSMIVLAVDSICATSPREEKAEECSTFIVEQVSSRIANIQFRVASREGSLLLFFILGTDKLAVPEVVLLISLLVGVVIGQTGFDLFAGRSLIGFSELQVLDLFLFGKFLGDVLVEVELGFPLWVEGGEISLHTQVKFFGQLPDRLAVFRVEVVVALGGFVVEYLEGSDELVDFLGVHKSYNRTQL